MGLSQLCAVSFIAYKGITVMQINFGCHELAFVAAFGDLLVRSHDIGFHYENELKGLWRVRNTPCMLSRRFQATLKDNSRQWIVSVFRKFYLLLLIYLLFIDCYIFIS